MEIGSRASQKPGTRLSIMAATLRPLVYWGQKDGMITLRIDLMEVAVDKVDLKEDSLNFLVDAVGSQGRNKYGFNLNFYLPVDPDSSKFRATDRAVEFQIKKKEEGEVWPRLTEQQIKLPWLKIDFDKFQYSDESDDESQTDQEAAQNLVREFEKDLEEHKSTDQVELKIAYMFMYNMFQLVGFVFMICVLTYNYIVHGPETKLRAFELVGYQMMVCQLAAILEVIHPLIGFVKTGVMAPFMQVFGRNFILFVLILQEPRLQDAPAVFYLFMTWSTVELVRYPFYMLSSIGLEMKFITWLRYSAWIPLYPLGLLFEATLVIMSIPLFEENGLFSIQLPNSANFAFYFPWFLHAYLLGLAIAGYQLMYHMYAQRKKKLCYVAKQNTAGSKMKKKK